jgi:hypothetical protein
MILFSPGYASTDEYKNFDAVIDNQNMTIEQSCQELVKILDEWGWFDNRIVVPQERPTKKPSTMAIK